jgi:hypothetical protein
MPHLKPRRPLPARLSRGGSFAARAGLGPASRVEGRREPTRGPLALCRDNHPNRFAARRPTVVTVALAATPAALGSFLH